MKVKYHGHITGKYRRSAQNLCNINLNTSEKTSVAFHNLQNFDLHIIFQDVFQVNIISKTIKNMNFNIKQPKKKKINTRIPLSFIGSVDFSNNSFDNLAKNLWENDFYHLSLTNLRVVYISYLM